jgi:hypothetical protein
MVESGRYPQRSAATKSCREACTSHNTPRPAEPLIETASQRSLSSQRRASMEIWCRDVRPRAVRLIAARTQTLRWSPALLALVLEELAIDDLFVELLGTARTIPRHRYAQAVAVAIALRHSWRPDSLASVANRLGLGLGLCALCRGREFHSASVRAARTASPTKTRPRRSSAAEKGKRS